MSRKKLIDPSPNRRYDEVYYEGLKVLNSELSEPQASERNTSKLDGRNEVNDLNTLLERASVALNDWLRTYAPEFCDEDAVKETYDRIMKNGGTLAYISDLQDDIRKHSNLANIRYCPYCGEEIHDGSVDARI